MLNKKITNAKEFLKNLTTAKQNRNTQMIEHKASMPAFLQSSDDTTTPAPSNDSTTNTFGGYKVYTGNDYVNPNERVAGAVNVATWYIVREGYYLGYDEMVGAFVVSDRKAVNSIDFYNGSDYFNIIHGVVYVNQVRKIQQLTRAEFNKLVEAKLPWESLRKCYKWQAGWNSFAAPMRFNLKTPTLVM